VQGARYVVQRGDYLRLISTWSYGTERLWPVIYDSNLRVIGANPDLIYPGQVLGIPTVSGRPQPGAPAGRRYTVRAGDTLASIALRVYGDAGRWPQLYRANVAAIGAAPGLIFPGTVLALP
jgi:nucleoid-associated protein YgaU